ncbi:MAG: mobile sperm domain-containing protein [Acidobacteria bacterium]|nr:mobile sperm domain-containing protein [Acidobacteriota bacterium]
MKFFTRFGLLILLAGMHGWAATREESALRARAARFYELQIAGRRGEAAQLVESKSRNLFLGGKSVPYLSCKVGRVVITGDKGEVEVTAEMFFPQFPHPLSRTFPTPWRKIGGKWYFVVDTSALQQVMTAAQGGVLSEARLPLSYDASVVFGADGKIEKKIRLKNNTGSPIRFRVASWDHQWLEIKNRTGEIPPGEGVPLEIVLQQIPRQTQALTIRVEGIESDQRITPLEIPVELQIPDPKSEREIERAIRSYRANQ